MVGNSSARMTIFRNMAARHASTEATTVGSASVNGFPAENASHDNASSDGDDARDAPVESVSNDDDNSSGSGNGSAGPSAGPSSGNAPAQSGCRRFWRRAVSLFTLPSKPTPPPEPERFSVVISPPPERYRHARVVPNATYCAHHGLNQQGDSPPMYNAVPRVGEVSLLAEYSNDTIMLPPRLMASINQYQEADLSAESRAEIQRFRRYVEENAYPAAESLHLDDDVPPEYSLIAARGECPTYEHAIGVAQSLPTALLTRPPLVRRNAWAVLPAEYGAD